MARDMSDFDEHVSRWLEEYDVKVICGKRCKELGITPKIWQLCVENNLKFQFVTSMEEMSPALTRIDPNWVSKVKNSFDCADTASTSTGSTSESEKVARKGTS